MDEVSAIDLLPLRENANTMSDQRLEEYPFVRVISMHVVYFIELYTGKACLYSRITLKANCLGFYLKYIIRIRTVAIKVSLGN
jgi:hypothetical protein